jgi:hypothetical protein
LTRSGNASASCWPIARATPSLPLTASAALARTTVAPISLASSTHASSSRERPLPDAPSISSVPPSLRASASTRRRSASSWRSRPTSAGVDRYERVSARFSSSGSSASAARRCMTSAAVSGRAPRSSDSSCKISRLRPSGTSLVIRPGGVGSVRHTSRSSESLRAANALRPVSMK